MLVILIETTHLSTLFSSIPTVFFLPSPRRLLCFVKLTGWPSAEGLPCEVCACLIHRDNLHIMAFYQSNNTLFGYCCVGNILVGFESSLHHNEN
jgi:hypothetical protein